MGLFNDESSHGLGRTLCAWSLPGVVIAVSAALALAGDRGRYWLRFDRAAIAAGELWRLLSGHFVHLSWSHFALNAMGLLLVCYLVGARFTALQWISISLLTIAGIDLGFWLWEPQLASYVGLSGLLHGILAAGIVAGLRLQHREAYLLGAVVVAKLAYEQLIGPMPGSEQSTGGAVIVAAHLYGALTGAVAGAVVPIRVGPPAPL